ncbi:MAG: ketopantoate reductase C-terminal domain-containing protein, partial [Candidatus Caenarcaniphilales bacterium]|nr:ketopantoate reductase C-terminal domain-containing protein [Candidatus Caenarcaniphilales bacterium]
IYKQAFGNDRVFRVVMNISASPKEAGSVFYKSGGTIIFEKGHSLAQLLHQSFLTVKVDSRISENIDWEIWNKAVWNASFNTVTALSRLTTSPILQDPDGLKLIRSLGKEVCKLAASYSIHLPEELIEQKIDFTLNKLGDITSSTREDVLQEKPIEYEAVIGDLIDIARERKIEVPYLETVFTLLKLLDKSFKNN